MKVEINKVRMQSLMDNRMAESGTDDPERQQYWEAKARGIGTRYDVLGAVMVTDNPYWAEYRDRMEKEHLFKIIELNKAMSVLDLGCGTGRYSVEFAEKCKDVLAIDYSPTFIEYARKAAGERGLDNIEFVCQSVAEYSYLENRYFDVIHLGGILMYLEDEPAADLVNRLKPHLRENGLIVKRDTTGLRKRIYGGNENPYICRTEDEYITMFQRNGFALVYSNYVMFPPLIIHIYDKLPAGMKRNKILTSLLNVNLALLARANSALLKQPWIIRLFIDPVRKITNRLSLYRHAELTNG